MKVIQVWTDLVLITTTNLSYKSIHSQISALHMDSSYLASFNIWGQSKYLGEIFGVRVKTHDSPFRVDKRLPSYDFTQISPTGGFRP